MSETEQITLQQIADALIETGVSAGSNVMLHSSLRNLGFIQGVPIRSYPEKLVSLILDIIGTSGTLCVPAPNWNYGKLKEPFDIVRSPVSKELGVISTHLLTRDGVRRSPNPIFSVAAVGKRAGCICDGATGTAFGEESAWDRMYKLGFDNVFLGCGIEYLSFTRYIEFRYGVPYLYNKRFEVPVLNDGEPMDVEVTAPLRYAHCPAEYMLEKFQHVLQQRGVYYQANLKEATVSRVSMADCYREGIECLKRDMHFFLKEMPPYESAKEPMI
ncbi:AAC(3) family N-acetyltransferase [Thalassospira povalilytica]|uniref:AAC(3) family N-acetyltransferase n=1 Tax=Thalassospira povalilytica TaxID=732237 RepID=UPI003AA9B0BD